MSTPSLNAFDDGSESSTATLCSTKAFSEYLAETTLAFVEVLGHKSGDAPLRPRTCVGAVVEKTFSIEMSVRHGPRISHQSHSKIENVSQVSTHT